MGMGGGGAGPVRSDVSIIVPAYDSQATLGGCLAALAAQTVGGFEVLVVDSSPHRACEPIVAAAGAARYVRSDVRLVPHHVHDVGVAHARGAVLVFLDPDVYPAEDWLARLLAAHAARGRAIAGAIACHGRRRRDRAIHLCKFGEWLPGGTARPLAIAPSTTFVIARDELATAGGFPRTPFFGDVELSRRLTAMGRPAWFEPTAIVRHHHRQGVGAFLRERVERGRGWGTLRVRADDDPRGLVQRRAVATPLRLGRILVRLADYARAAGELDAFVAGLPLLLAGHAAWLWGETIASLAATRREDRRLRPPIPRGAS